MRSEVLLGRVLGVPVAVHQSWLFIFALLVILLTTGYFPVNEGGAARWAAGVLTALGFFGSVLFHELCHARVAKEWGLPVRRVTLFLLGGVAALGLPVAAPRVEWEIAVAGPVGSLFLAAVFFLAEGIWTNGGGSPEMGGVALAYLRDANLLLAAFNLVPAYPLDGGRVLRALLWWLVKDRARATRVAAACGRGFAAILAAGGLFLALGAAAWPGLWFTFLGWFLWRVIPWQVRAELGREG